VLFSKSVISFTESTYADTIPGCSTYLQILVVEVYADWESCHCDLFYIGEHVSWDEIGEFRRLPLFSLQRQQLKLCPGSVTVVGQPER
jgi:hypothetical protein